MKYYSQFNQDKWLFENHFKDKKDGVFLEIGADDGVDKSNTKFYEELGWKGMCIEPSHKRFKLLSSNRNCICENYAISDKVGDVEFMDISGWGKGLSGIVEKYDVRHKNRIQQELRHPQNKGNEIITVKTELLSNLLDKHNITDIDFCTIWRFGLLLMLCCIKLFQARQGARHHYFFYFPLRVLKYHLRC